jgi:hypothetical protein
VRREFGIREARDVVVVERPTPFSLSALSVPPSNFDTSENFKQLANSAGHLDKLEAASGKNRPAKN